MAKINELQIGPVKNPADVVRAIQQIAGKINEVIRALNTLLP